MEEANCILSVIKQYEQASGQLVNLDKSAISFSRNVPDTSMEMIRNRMGVKAVDVHDKYLGLPTIIGRSKKQIFSKIQERVWAKLQGWKEKTLSKAGKEILLKSVAQAIPSYVMSCFKLPGGTCQKIESLMANFWWGQKENERKLHWINWKQLCKPRDKGGLGFRDIADFNQALLAKQVWRLLHVEDSLLHKVWKAKYFPKSSLLEAKVGYQPSYAWRSVWNAIEGVKEGMSWRVGDGNRISIWDDSWLLGEGDGRIIAQRDQRVSKVADLIHLDRRIWNSNLIDQVFPQAIATAIKSIPLGWNIRQDFSYWKWSRNGLFSVKSAYYHIQKVKNEQASSTSSSPFPWRKLWKTHLPGKIKHFAYRLATNSLPCRENLSRRGIQTQHECILCEQQVTETMSHLFLQCQWSRAAWFVSPIGLRTDTISDSFSEWFKNCCAVSAPKDLVQIFQGLWCIWRARNDKLHNSTRPQPDVIMQNGWKSLHDWEEVQGVHEQREGEIQIRKWEPPPEGTIKINIDAGWSGPTSTGFGMVARSHDSLMMFAATHLELHRLEPTIAEAMALRWSLHTAKELHMDNIMLESDSLIVINATRAGRSRPDIEPIIEDCRQLLLGFNSVVVKHASRRANNAAHVLASLAVNYSSKYWWDEPPRDLAEAILVDTYDYYYE